MTSSSSNPIRSFFKSSSSPDNEPARSKPKLKLSKAATTATGAAKNTKSALFNLIHPPDLATAVKNTGQSNMLFPPAALFPLLTGPETKSPKAKQGLFTKTKRQKVGSTSVASKIKSSTIPTTTESTQPWPAWMLGVSSSSPSNSLSVSNDVAADQAKSSQVRLWTAKSGSRSEDKQAAKAEKRKTKLLAAEDNNCGLGPYSGGGQTLLHSSYNQSNQSLTPFRSTSPHYPDSHHSCQQHQQQHQQHSHPRIFGVTLAIHDIFGIGKVSEMSLALFLAHDAFLSRRPFWLQCAILAWEGVLAILVLWGVLRIVGLAEVVVWGADDLIRGVVSMFRTLSLALKMFIFSW